MDYYEWLTTHYYPSLPAPLRAVTPFHRGSRHALRDSMTPDDLIDTVVIAYRVLGFFHLDDCLKTVPGIGKKYAGLYESVMLHCALKKKVIGDLVRDDPESLYSMIREYVKKNRNAVIAVTPLQEPGRKMLALQTPSRRDYNRFRAWWLENMDEHE
jgi:hypothetical protein